MRKDYEILGIEQGADEKTIKRAYFKLIRTYSPEKDPERFQEIRAAYERLIEAGRQSDNKLELEFPKDDAFAMNMFDRIQQLMQEQEYGMAVKTAKEGMKYYDDMECFLYMYARCSVMDEKPGNAIKAYEKLIKKFPDKLYYKSELAKAYRMRGYGRKAYAMFRAVYEQGWREADFLIEYGMCCMERNEPMEGVHVLEVFVDSVQPEDGKNKIAELMNAYSGLFTFYLHEHYDITGVIEKCREFLDRAGSRVQEYEWLLGDLFMAVFDVCYDEGCREAEVILHSLKNLMPENEDAADLLGMCEAYDIQSDERFGMVMKYTIETFMTSDIPAFIDAYGEAQFKQLDALLCQLEEWPKQKAELEIVRQEYPHVYECGTDLWEILKKGKNELRHIKEMILEEYVRLERIYQCGKYYEFYPDRHHGIDQVQWDSMESGTFVRDNKKIGRNDPCPCGSGKKYKNCCERN